MADISQQGPLSAEDLLAIWQASVDSAYAGPLVAAGDGGGLEVHSQSFAQWARVSLAVDRTFQSMYALPWSGQTNPPASGAAQSTCELAFTRADRLGDPLVLGAGLIWVDEEAVDASPSGPAAVTTGRRYLLQTTVVFLPGEQGPWTGIAQAEKPGTNYDDPAPDSLTLLEQLGATRENDLATVAVTLAPLPPATPTPAQTVVLTGDDMPDMFTPDQIGQYVVFTSGANAGMSARAVGFYPPTSTAGSGILLEQMVVVLLSGTPSPAFEVGGSPVVFDSGVTPEGSGVLLAAREGPGGYCLAFSLVSGGAPVVGDTVSQPLPTGTATGTVALVYAGGQYAAEAPSGVPLAGGAGWRMAEWAQDWGLVATNPASPSGGALAMLDALGQEKDLPRLPGESDDEYRLRITRIADVVTPNAVKRALVRDVGATGWCLREVGGALLPGFFFDRRDAGGDAWDYGSLLFSGSYASGNFAAGELVEYRRGLSVLAVGYWGSTSTPTVTANPAGYAPAASAVPTLAASPGAAFTLVLARAGYDVPTPAIAWESGDSIVGLDSGAVFAPSGTIADPYADSLRWHCWLSYDEFRAFFIVQVPSVGYGDFGFAWDMPAAFGQQVAAYDAGPLWLNFYDGFPVGAEPYYLRIFKDVSNVIAGGVGWELEQSNGAPCS